MSSTHCFSISFHLRSLLFFSLLLSSFLSISRSSFFFLFLLISSSLHLSILLSFISFIFFLLLYPSFLFLTFLPSFFPFKAHRVERLRAAAAAVRASVARRALARPFAYFKAAAWHARRVGRVTLKRWRRLSVALAHRSGSRAWAHLKR